MIGFILGLGAMAVVAVVGVHNRISFRNNLPVLIVLVLLAVFIPLSIIILLPTDWVNRHVDKLPGIWMPDNAYWITWRIDYWVTFALTWLILPMLLEYYRSGHYAVAARLVDAFRANLKFQLMMLALGVVCGFYFMMEVGLLPGHIKDMVMGLTHIYSLVLTLWLMAHSLVAIPRHRWLTASPVANLNYLYAQVPLLVDKLDDTRASFREDILKVMMLANNFANELQWRDWILSLERQIPDDLRNQLQREYRAEESQVLVAEIDETYMVNLTKSFNRHHYNLTAYLLEYTQLLLEITRIEDTLNHDPESVVYRFSTLNPKRTYYLTMHVYPWASRVVAVVLAVLSVVVFESEMMHSTKFSLVNLVVTHVGPYLQILLVMALFSYMLIATLLSLTLMKVFNMYHLVPHNLDPCLALWFAMYVARMTIPLLYNFLGLFVDRNSVFEDWFGKLLQLTGLFLGINEWLPRFILVPILLTAFHVYDRVKQKVGWTEWFDDDDDDEEAAQMLDGSRTRNELVIAEAKRLVDREMHRRSRGG